MLVDDEPFILEGLRQIIQWGEYGVEIVATAGDGFEALALLKTMEIHIVLTDIKMPDMTGIELISEIKKKYAKVKCIVFSGFDDFEYVKEAVKLGVENYLLKPVDVDELKSTMQSAVQKIEYEISVKADIEKASEILHENLLIRWVSGDIGIEELQEKASYLGVDTLTGHFLVGLIKCLSHGYTIPNEKDYEAENRALYRLRVAAREISDGICSEAFERGGSCVAFCDYNGYVILLFCALQEEDLKSKYADILNECIQKIKSELACDTFVAIGPVVGNCLSVRQSYNGAKKGLESLPVSGLGKEITNPLVKMVLTYVDSHYFEGLSLKIISIHFNVNSSYLGKLIKSETGEMFSQYLHRCRIKRATEMLMNTRLSANEIAKKVGYQSVNYFYNVFKKVTGEFPTQYKHSHADQG